MIIGDVYCRDLMMNLVKKRIALLLSCTSLWMIEARIEFHINFTENTLSVLFLYINSLCNSLMYL